MIKRVIFCGMHNKPGMQPLDSKTQTGKIIDSIIEKIKGENVVVMKCNFYDLDEWPRDGSREDFFKWQFQNDINLQSDLVVVLGLDVLDRMRMGLLDLMMKPGDAEDLDLLMVNFIKAFHPASRQVQQAPKAYIYAITAKILSRLYGKVF